MKTVNVREKAERPDFGAIYCQRTVDGMKTEDYLIGDLTEGQPSSSNKKSFACKYCEKQFTLQSNMKRHIKMKHLPPGQRLLVCHRCNFKTYDSDSLAAHKAWHANEVAAGCKPYECYHCGSRFVSLYSVRKHIVSSHPIDKIYKCKHCPYVNGLKYRYLGHLAKHRDPENSSLVVNCDICGATTRKSYLAKHVQICHSGTPAPYACASCDFKTWFIRDFQSHSYIHTGERPFGCHHCGHTAKRKSHIRMHVESCTEKRFSCPYCNFESRYQYEGRKHISQSHPGSARQSSTPAVKDEPVEHEEFGGHLSNELVIIKVETDDVEVENIVWDY